LVFGSIIWFISCLFINKIYIVLYRSYFKIHVKNSHN
jgi:hypothetical protein